MFLVVTDNGTTTTPSPPPDGPSNELSLTWPFIAGVFALMACTLSLYEIYQHLLYYNKPYLQKYIVRILIMVPIYALNSVSWTTFGKSSS